MGLLRSTLLILIPVLLALPATAKDWKVIRIGTDASYVPFNYLDDNNRIQGFNIDIANALCARMKARCEFVQVEWKDIVPALLAHRFDAIIASMAITEERKKEVAFTNRYYQSPANFVVRKAANLRDTSPAAMKGRVIGAQADTIHARFLQNVYVPAGAKVKLFTEQEEVQLELARGRLDALLAGKVGLYEWLKKTELGACCEFAGKEVRDPAYIGEGVGIALRKEDSDLKERFNDAIAAILADGTYKRINGKYFPFNIY